MRTRSTMRKFSRKVASGTRSRGDAAIIVQIKENVNSLSFASRVTPGNIQRRTRDKKNSSYDFCESGRRITTDFTGITSFFEGNAARRR